MRRKYILIRCIILLSIIQTSLAPPCDHAIYCRGKLLHEVQMKSIFPDSKTFVDMKLKEPRGETMEKYESLLKKEGGKITREKLEDFVKSNFDPVASEFEKWNPPDWKPVPKFLKQIKDPKLWEFGKKLNTIWKFLGRKITDVVRESQELYSIIYIPYGVIIPGGRFREIYYWDSYWIIRGLLTSEMFYTARGIIANFLYMIRTVGLIPNGGRIYYTGRSQPPVVIPMMKSYIDVTKDIDFLREHLDTLEEELSFWLKYRTVNVTVGGASYRLARYYEDSLGPRPESYREDIHLGSVFPDANARQHFYCEIKAAAESGQDFTSRWFISSKATNQGDLTSTKVRSILPVELNSIIYWNASILARFAKEMGLKKKADKYSHIAREWQVAVDRVLWHEDLGIWLDYDIINKKRRDYFYPSNLSPLWTGCYFKDRQDELGEKMLAYMERNKINTFPGGIPTSMWASGQQWDLPNAWPPLQDIVVSALEATDDPRAQRLARELALRWVWTNYRGWVDTKVMHEKYDATKSGAPGAGGEYESQMGFGWTNGLVLDLMERYSDQLVPEEEVQGRVQRPEVALYSKAIMLSMVGLTVKKML